MSNLRTAPVQAMIQTINAIKRWIPPDTNSYKINFDASWVDEINLAGYGLILRSETGSAIQAGSGTFYASSPEEAEALTLLEAARWATSMNCKQHWRHMPSFIHYALAYDSSFLVSNALYSLSEDNSLLEGSHITVSQTEIRAANRLHSLL